MMAGPNQEWFEKDLMLRFPPDLIYIVGKDADTWANSKMDTLLMLSDWLEAHEADLEGCSHPDDARQVEDTEVDTMRNGEHDTYPVQIYVCGVCNETLEGDPAADAAEDRADAEADAWRDEQ